MKAPFSQTRCGSNRCLRLSQTLTKPSLFVIANLALISSKMFSRLKPVTGNASMFVCPFMIVLYHHFLFCQRFGLGTSGPNTAIHGTPFRWYAPDALILSCMGHFVHASPSLRFSGDAQCLPQASLTYFMVSMLI